MGKGSSLAGLTEMYLNENLGIQKIADIVHVSPATVWKKLKDNNITIRPKSEGIRLSHQRGDYEHLKKHIDKEILEKMYLEGKKPLSEVANFFNVSLFTVRKYAKRWGTPIRTRAESNKLKASRQKAEMELAYTFPLGFILGTIMGDGSLHKDADQRCVIELRVVNRCFAEEFQRNLKEVTGKKGSFFEVDSKSKIKGRKYITHLYCVVLTSKLWYLILSELKEHIITYDAYNIPFMKGFVQGFYDSEGCYMKTENRKRIMLSNNSKHLLLSVKRMLEKLGVNNVYLNSQTTTHYTLCIYRQDEVNKFVNIFGIKPKSKGVRN